MLNNRCALRSSTLILSSTLFAMAAEQPLPVPTDLSTIRADTNGGKANVSYGDVDGDGFVDLGIGGKIYWGGPNGFAGASSNQPFGGTQLWIVPNVTGAGAGGVTRADLVGPDSSGYASLFQSTGTRNAITGPTPKLALTGLKGKPAVGDFRGSALPDIAWIDDSGNTGANLQVAVNNGSSFTAATPFFVGSADYAAVAALDWTGAQTGHIDLLLVHDDLGVSTMRLYPFGTTTASLVQPLKRGLLDIPAGNNYLPDITVGKIHSGTDHREDAMVTSTSVYLSLAIFASVSTTVPANLSAFPTNYQGWIVPDVTGDGIDEVAFYSYPGIPPGGGLLHGGSSIGSDITNNPPAADRPIPGGTNPLFGIGYNSVVATSRYPIAISYATTGSTWDRHLLLVDYNGYSGGSTSLSQAMPILAPTISGQLLAQSGTGAQPIVDPTVMVQFQSPGVITAIKVTVSGAVLGDAISDASLPPATSADAFLNGDLTRVYSGNLTIPEVQTLLGNLRFTGVAGGGQRSVTISVGGMAVSGDSATRASAYLSNTFSAATVDVAVPPSLTFTTIMSGTVGTPVSCEVRGGSAPYTVVVDGGTGVVNTASGVSTVVVTPTRTGLITVTVTDESLVTGVFTFIANVAPVPGLVFSKASNASVGGTIIVEVSGGDGTYTVTVSGGSGFTGGSPDLANLNTTTNLFITPTRAGVITVTVSDSTGLTGEFSFTASNLPTAREPAPAVEPSLGTATVFGAICPGTVGGVTSLRTAFGSVDNRRARGFTWDSETQTYRELPAEPTGGLLPTDGVFLATRVALGLDFSGPAMPPGSTIVLRAGWNFVGMGPVQLGSGTVVRSHSLADDFTLTNLSGATVPLSQITQAYQWNGTEYVTTPILQSGVGYWIGNATLPHAALLLTRKDSDLDGRVVRSTEAFAGNVGAPPMPPNGDQQAQPEGHGSCGSGSGVAVLLAGLMAFLKFGFRRK